MKESPMAFRKALSCNWCILALAAVCVATLGCSTPPALLGDGPEERAPDTGGQRPPVAAADGAEREAARAPNIVLIVADDLGYADLGVHGATQFATPHIDSIAERGARFTNAYVTSPVCGPSRAGLMVGQYQDRFGYVGNTPPGAEWGLPTDERTIATNLKDAGYKTAYYGKWHLGEEKRYRPLQRGFDEFYGFLGGVHSYFRVNDRAFGPIVQGDNEPAELDQYLTFALADRASSFLRQREGERDPFFLMLAFNAPHTPLQAPESYLKKTQHIEDPKRSIYAAMVMAMDDAVGQVLGTLRKTGARENTLIVFLSDNGGSYIPQFSENGASNEPLRGSKGQLWEGGVRVPFFASWPGRIPAGTVIDEPIITLDLYPTFSEVAGAEVTQELPGMDLTDLLFSKEPLPRRAFFWDFPYYGNQSAARVGDMKWVRMRSEDRLYNLAKDVTETADLAKAQPAQLQKLKTQWKTWNRKNAPRRLSQTVGRKD